jgi:formylglycine-generating enzyme required for sulfatase activity
MVLIRGGTFLMGSPESEGDRNNDEGPLHSVTVQSFFMGKYEVTQAQWHAVMGNNPSFFPGCARCPVEKVSWLDAKEFVRRLNEMQSGYSYRLPSEAEWEYASRAGTTTPFAFGSSLSPSQAAFRLEKPVSVGGYQPNNWGLYDMHGNVTEWCEDWYHGDYNAAPTDGIAWLSGGEQKQRVVRGGNWGNSSVRFLRSANRMDVYRYGPGFGGNWIGFRLAASGR